MKLRCEVRRALAAVIVIVIAMTTPGHVAAQTSCGEGVGVVSGRVVDVEGHGIRGVIVRVGENCGAAVDSTGYFRLAGFSTDSVLVEPSALGYCIVPKYLGTRALAHSSEFVGVSDPGWTDAVLPVHGTPYSPPSYGVWRCRDRIAREAYGGSESTVGADLPTPEVLLGWVLHYEPVSRLMRDAAATQDTVPLSFHYGEVGHAQPDGPTPYTLTDNPNLGMYIVVLSASNTAIRVQVGRWALSHGATDSPVGEYGLLLEWRREGTEWDEGSVVDAWSPTG